MLTEEVIDKVILITSSQRFGIYDLQVIQASSGKFPAGCQMFLIEERSCQKPVQWKAAQTRNPNDSPQVEETLRRAVLMTLLWNRKHG